MEELWNKKIEEAKVRFNWSDEEMAEIYRIAVKIIENIKARSIQAITEL